MVSQCHARCGPAHQRVKQQCQADHRPTSHTVAAKYRYFAGLGLDRDSGSAYFWRHWKGTPQHWSNGKAVCPEEDHSSPPSPRSESDSRRRGLSVSVGLVGTRLCESPWRQESAFQMPEWVACPSPSPPHACESTPSHPWAVDGIHRGKFAGLRGVVTTTRSCTYVWWSVGGLLG